MPIAPAGTKRAVHGAAAAGAQAAADVILPGLLQAQARRHGSLFALREKKFGIWQTYT